MLKKVPLEISVCVCMSGAMQSKVHCRELSSYKQHYHISAGRIIRNKCMTNMSVGIYQE